MIYFLRFIIFKNSTKKSMRGSLTIRQMDCRTNRQIAWQIDKQMVRQTDRQSDKGADRQTDRINMKMYLCLKQRKF